MARSDVVFTREASLDLDALYDWVARDSGLPRADAVLMRTGQTLDLIAGMPGMGRVRHDLEGRPQSFAVWPWVIFYQPRAGVQGIEVLRVIDGRRDVPRHIISPAGPTKRSPN